MKTLGQIAYESTKEGGRQNFGPWKNAPEVVRRVHEKMAKAVERAVIRRQKNCLVGLNVVGLHDCTERFSRCLDCDDKNHCKRYSRHLHPERKSYEI